MTRFFIDYQEIGRGIWIAVFAHLPWYLFIALYCIRTVCIFNSACWIFLPPLTRGKRNYSSKLREMRRTIIIQSTVTTSCALTLYFAIFLLFYFILFLRFGLVSPSFVCFFFYPLFFFSFFDGFYLQKEIVFCLLFCFKFLKQRIQSKLRFLHFLHRLCCSFLWKGGEWGGGGGMGGRTRG